MKTSSATNADWRAPDERPPGPRGTAPPLLGRGDVWVRSDLEGRILDVSESVSRFGTRREEFLGTFTDRWYTDPDQGQRMREMIIAAGELNDVEVELRTASGEARFVAVTARLVFDPEGRPVACESMLRDITRRRQLESRLREAESLGALGQLARGVAHDFNNLLTVISGHASMMSLSAPAGSQTAADLAAILQCCDQGEELTQRLMQFGRTTQHSATPADVNETVRSTVGMLSRALRGGIRIELDLANEPLPVAMRAVELQEILTNLALNARDAMPAGGVLTIRSRCMPAALESTSALACFEVQDRGHGMSEQVCAKALEPFFTTKAPHGTGLGLALVDKAVRDHGGNIEIDSTPGSGTCIRIRLPLAGS